MDQFTEATLIAKPMIYISLQELYDTHVLLLEYLDKIAPEKNDPLRDLLNDLGDSPSICSLLGAANDNGEDSSITHLAKTEVSTDCFEIRIDLVITILIFTNVFVLGLFDSHQQIYGINFPSKVGYGEIVRQVQADDRYGATLYKCRQFDWLFKVQNSSLSRLVINIDKMK